MNNKCNSTTKYLITHFGRKYITGKQLNGNITAGEVIKTKHSENMCITSERIKNKTEKSELKLCIIDCDNTRTRHLTRRRLHEGVLMYEHRKKKVFSLGAILRRGYAINYRHKRKQQMARLEIDVFE